jgi:hypothetical protein
MLVAQVEAALLDWHRHQAPETLKGSLTDDEFKATLEMLVSDDIVAWLITLVNFLHQEFVKGAPCYPHELEAERAMVRLPLLASSSVAGHAYHRCIHEVERFAFCSAG